MRLIAIVSLALVLIDFGTADLPTTLLRTSKKPRLINEKGRNEPVQDVEETLERRLPEVEGIVNNIVAARGNVYERVPALKQSQSINLPFMQKLEDFDSLFNLQHLWKVIRRQNDKQSVIQILEERIGALPMAEKLEANARCNDRRHYEVVKKLQQLQLIDWYERRVSVMEILEFDKEPEEITVTWKTKVLKKYIALRKRKYQVEDTIAAEYSKFYGETKFLKMLANTKIFVNRKRTPASKFVIQLEGQVLDDWHSHGLQPETVLAGLTVKQVVKFLRTSKDDVVLAQYPRIQLSGEKSGRLYSWVELLVTQYPLSDVIVELFLSKTNRRIDSLLKQELKTWVEEGWSLDKVNLEVKFEDENVLANHANKKALLEAYAILLIDHTSDDNELAMIREQMLEFGLQVK